KEYLLYKLSDTVKKNSNIDSALYKQFGVKRGLRNEDHSGVLVGLTRVGDVVGYKKNDNGTLEAIPGKLVYRGIDIEDLAHGVEQEGRMGFEETAFLLLSGYLPDQEELETFSTILNEQMILRHSQKMNILQTYGDDIMNILARSVLQLYTYDPTPDDTSRTNLIKQSVDLISKFPAIIAYAYHTMNHYKNNGSLHIRHPKPQFSLAENFIYMMKGSTGYTELDVKVLDLCLVLHADHGGGNNSTFTTRVTSSSGTDTYSSIAAAIGSLKGPLHGGANIKVMDMFIHLRQALPNWEDREQVKAYLMRILRKEVYDKKGLIYGIGHAVYTISDPRAVLLKEMARKLAKEKRMEREFAFLELVEELGVESFMEYKGTSVGKSVCANVDFYSGFVYEMIGLPKDIYTPLFAMSRIAGWAAHRIEELNLESRRIIRPAYKNVCESKKYTPLNKR
ncbi:MAG: citrate synthase, partial [Mucinivorans sp.]